MEQKSFNFEIFLYPSLLILTLWVVYWGEFYAPIDIVSLGIMPRTLEGLSGVFFSPLIHSTNDIYHLINNSIPVFVLSVALLFYYRKVAFQVFFWVYLMTGVWVWAAGRDSYHIGASGIIYGFITFLFFSGIFRKDTRLMALSLFVTFLYGGAIWGILPFQKGISWESHLLGSLAGIITAYNFRKEGPPPRTYDLGNDEENEKIDVSGDDQYTPEMDNPKSIDIHYNFIEKEKDKE